MEALERAGGHVQEWYATWRSDVEAFHPDVILWLFGGADNLDHLVNGRTLEAGTAESDDTSAGATEAGR